MRVTLLLFFSLAATLAGCKPNPMDENKFWSIIAASKGTGADEEHAARLERNLRILPSDQIDAFDKIYWQLHKKAETGPVWAAGLLLNHGHGTDDGFEYFRNWLIAQGRSTYERALANPDSLATVQVELTSYGPEAEWESYGYAAIEAYKVHTGKFLREEFNQQNVSYRILNKAPKFDWPEYTDAVLAEQLPELWRKYGEYKRAFGEAEKKRLEAKQQEGTKSTYIDGFGKISVGDQIEHRRFGIGTIKSVDATGLHISVMIAFGDVEKWMAVLPESGLWKLPK